MCNNLESIIVKGIAALISLLVFDLKICGFDILIDN